MRRTLSATDANNHLADALRQAEDGDLVLITR
ncbi:MAG: type II toxin-antitoxin system prevent-host-death family antitoxin [bacterium]|nr:type II toxin-antitoxin system prevent-host-death family antitoxin [bacterium]